jgi:RNA polymerase sigma factor (sigma-70 family)
LPASAQAVRLVDATDRSFNIEVMTAMVALTSNEVMGVFMEARRSLERVMAYRVGCRHTAQDLTQELYLRVLKLASTFPTQDDARRYLVRMAINAATDHVRVEGRRTELLAGALSLFEDHPATPEDVMVAGDQLRSIESALQELPDKCRDVLYLSHVEGLTHAEIAERLGVSRSLVEKYSVRALMHCKAHLSSKG